jgi:Uma2 family endonuclease
VFGEEIVRPDVAGWRRERSPQRPTGTGIALRPDWICEVISPGNAANDTVKKLRLYHRAGVPHYWLVDPREATLSVLRWSEPGYITLQTATRGEIVRAEPFEQIAIPVGTLFGEDPPVAEP